MTLQNKKTELCKDYEIFLSGANTIPAEVNERILTSLKKMIKPNPWRVFVKLLGFQIFIGLLSLSVCHQFEMNPFQTNFSIADWFMSIGGHGFCMLGCGLFYLGLGLTIAGYFMSVEEVRVIKKNEVLQIISLGFISLTLFALLGAELILTFAGLWLLGAILGGFVAAETVFRLKTT